MMMMSAAHMCGDWREDEGSPVRLCDQL